MKLQNTRYLIYLTLIMLLLVGCNTAPADVRAGEWRASTDFGNLTLIVNESGTAITKAIVEYKCSSGGVTRSGTVTFDLKGEGLPIENNRFDLNFESTQIRVQGKFSSDNTQATGKVTALSCSSKWESSR
jgi:hypothetical protein